MNILKDLQLNKEDHHTTRGYKYIGCELISLEIDISILLRNCKFQGTLIALNSYQILNQVTAYAYERTCAFSISYQMTNKHVSKLLIVTSTPTSNNDFVSSKGRRRNGNLRVVFGDFEFGSYFNTFDTYLTNGTISLPIIQFEENFS